MHFASLRPQRLVSRLAGKRPLRPAFLLTGVMGLTLLGAQFGLGTAQAANLKYYWQRGLLPRQRLALLWLVQRRVPLHPALVSRGQRHARLRQPRLGA